MCVVDMPKVAHGPVVCPLHNMFMHSERNESCLCFTVNDLIILAEKKNTTAIDSVLYISYRYIRTEVFNRRSCINI